MITTKWLFLAALAGHLLCGVCDCWLTYLPNGRFKFDYMKDNQKLSEVFAEMPPRNAILSMVLGCPAMCMMFFGYLALALWMRPISTVHANWMLLAVGLIFTFGMAHHILCGVPEWLYVRLGRAEGARQIITELFHKTSVTMFVCYAGFLIFGAALFAAVVSGLTPLPKWACVFNTTLLMLVLMPTRVGGVSAYRFRLFGVIPFGTHTIRIERFDMDEIQSREHNEHIPVWDHKITLKEKGEETEYIDEVEIRAGWKTVFVWLWAKAFYAHRQRKWIRLLKEDRV